MDNITSIINCNDPVRRMYDSEFDDCFVKFCSFVCIVNNKKINLANIFILILKDKRYRDVYKMLSDIDSDYDILLKFLQYDSSLYKSKYISNYLNSVEAGCALK